MKVYYEKTVSAEALVASRLVMCQDGGYRNFPNLKVVTQTYRYLKKKQYTSPGISWSPGALAGVLLFITLPIYPESFTFLAS